jgi:ribosomal protein L24
MPVEMDNKLRNGDACLVVAGTHKGKSGVVQDLHSSRTGVRTLTVVQANAIRFKTLARNAVLAQRP